MTVAAAQPLVRKTGFRGNISAKGGTRNLKTWQSPVLSDVRGNTPFLGDEPEMIATEACDVEEYLLVGAGTFAEIFSSIGDRDDVVFTEDQFIGLLEENAGALRGARQYAVLLKIKGKGYVPVRFDKTGFDSFEQCVELPDNETVWDTQGSGLRILVPAQAK